MKKRKMEDVRRMLRNLGIPCTSSVSCEVAFQVDKRRPSYVWPIGAIYSY